MANAKEVERNIKNLGLNNEIIEGENKYHQLIKFNSLGHLVESVNLGIRSGDWCIKSSKDNAPGKDSVDHFTYGTEYETETKTELALNEGKASKNVMKQIKELANRLKPIIGKKSNNGFSIKRKRRFGEEGNDLDIDRLLSGDSFHWTRMSRNNTPPSVKLFMSSSANEGTKEEVFNTGAAILIQTCLHLEKMGFSVEIIGIISCSSGNDKLNSFNITYPLKKASEKLDIMRVSTIGLQGILRKYGLDCIENLMSGGYDGSGGSRSSISIKKEVKENLGITDANLIDIGALRGSHRAEEYFSENLDNLYKQLGIN